MDITSKNEDKALIISVSGRMDAVTASDFENALTEFLDQGNSALIIDFSNLDYISSAGLRSILASAKKMKGINGTLSLACLKEVVKEVFDISGFSAIIPIYDSVETALEAM
ncbi:MAG: STAS domain-containing protein [Deltaproteobacteria bacterium]|nr:STAS domain-containing protein [Deltaproteobacteria bacterium]MBW2206046.1 STAS domain-containing protein [Deltaproteobacteria bacterium]